MLDLEASVSIISLKEWPPSWPLQATNTTFAGLKTKNANKVYQSISQLLYKGPKGFKTVIQPFVISILINLWGQERFPSTS